MTNSFVLIYCTVPDAETAKKLAEGLVGERLCACVSIVPKVQSVYRWQGKVETAEELLLIAKTTQETAKQAGVYIKNNHPYEVPEIIGVPITGGSESYLKWIEEAVKK